MSPRKLLCSLAASSAVLIAACTAGGQPLNVSPPNPEIYYFRGYARVDYAGGKSEFEIELKYFDGEPVIKDIKRVSTPGRRVYSSVKDLPTVANGLGVAILSTPKGVMSDSRARTENVGGEILCSIF